MKIGDCVISTELGNSLAGQSFDLDSGQGLLNAISALIIANGGKISSEYDNTTPWEVGEEP